MPTFSFCRKHHFMYTIWMSFKSFFIKKALQFKGVGKDQAEAMAKQLDEHPELASALKSLEANPEVKALFEKIQKEVEEKKKQGMADSYATMSVMTKHQAEIAKYRDELAPLAQLMQKR